MGSALKGSGPTQDVHIPPPLRPPMHGMANWMGNQLPSLWGQALPSYKGNLDPGLSPTMGRGIGMLQDRATSPGPQILGNAQGTLGALMNPGQSGLRNPFSMSSMSGGGGMAMTPQALQSSRDAMMRFQNPQYNLAVPRMSQGYGAPFAPPSFGQPPQPPQGGGPFGARPQTPAQPGGFGGFGIGGGQQAAPPQFPPGSSQANFAAEMADRRARAGLPPLEDYSADELAADRQTPRTFGGGMQTQGPGTGGDAFGGGQVSNVWRGQEQPGLLQRGGTDQGFGGRGIEPGGGGLGGYPGQVSNLMGRVGPGVDFTSLLRMIGGGGGQPRPMQESMPYGGPGGGSDGMAKRVPAGPGGGAGAPPGGWQMPPWGY